MQSGSVLRDYQGYQQLIRRFGTRKDSSWVVERPIMVKMKGETLHYIDTSSRIDKSDVHIRSVRWQTNTSDQGPILDEYHRQGTSPLLHEQYAFEPGRRHEPGWGLLNAPIFRHDRQTVDHAGRASKEPTQSGATVPRTWKKPLPLAARIAVGIGCSLVTLALPAYYGAHCTALGPALFLGTTQTALLGFFAAAGRELPDGVTHSVSRAATDYGFLKRSAGQSWSIFKLTAAYGAMGLGGALAGVLGGPAGVAVCMAAAAARGVQQGLHAAPPRPMQTFSLHPRAAQKKAVRCDLAQQEGRAEELMEGYEKDIRSGGFGSPGKALQELQHGVGVLTALGTAPDKAVTKAYRDLVQKHRPQSAGAAVVQRQPGTVVLNGVAVPMRTQG